MLYRNEPEDCIYEPKIMLTDSKGLWGVECIRLPLLAQKDP